MTNVNKILPVVLVALILISAVQAFQLNTLKEKLEGGTLSASTGSKSPVSGGAGGGSAVASSGGGGGGAPASIANLPNMVGGC